MDNNSMQALRDKDYWNSYYAKGVCPTTPSAFAEYVCPLLEPNRTLIDLGCGNGRDALFFAHNHFHVIAVDSSIEAITNLRKQTNGTISCVLDDFVHSSVHKPGAYDYAYSRFTLHAINEDQGKILIANVFRGLKSGGKLFIEVRGTKDPLFGLGEQIARNTYVYNGHSRRFLVLAELKKELVAAGFSIEYATEQMGFAVLGADNPPVIRVIAVKPPYTDCSSSD